MSGPEDNYRPRRPLTWTFSNKVVLLQLTLPLKRPSFSRKGTVLNAYMPFSFPALGSPNISR